MSEQQVIMAAMQMGGYASVCISPSTEDEFTETLARLREATGTHGTPFASERYAWMRIDFGAEQQHGVSIFAPTGSIVEQHIRSAAARMSAKGVAA